MAKAINVAIANNFFMVLEFLMVIVSFLRFAMQKYSISQSKKPFVKPHRGLVYHLAKTVK